jgi:hypothetical protein
MAELREVVGSKNEGRRIYLTLKCGHKKLHNPRAAIPRRAHCQECTIGASA